MINNRGAMTAFTRETRKAAGQRFIDTAALVERIAKNAQTAEGGRAEPLPIQLKDTSSRIEGQWRGRLACNLLCSTNVDANPSLFLQAASWTTSGC